MALNYAVILAGGSGNRLKNTTPKAFIKINELFLLEYSILQFNAHKDINHIILVVPPDYINISKELIEEKGYGKVQQVVTGGPTRFESSKKGLKNIIELDSRVLIHDAARPFITEGIISNCLKNLKYSDAVTVLAPISDSLVELDQQKITKSIDRKLVRQVQTPQGFIVKTIKKAHEMAINFPQKDITDDFNLVLKYQTGRISWVEGSKMNFKITFPEDLLMAEYIIAKVFS